MVDKTKARVGEKDSTFHRSCSNDIIVNAVDRTVNDKKNQTTNVPSNYCTAIMMPLNGTPSNLQQFKLFHDKRSEKDVYTDNGNEQRAIAMIQQNDKEARDRYIIHF